MNAFEIERFIAAQFHAESLGPDIPVRNFGKATAADIGVAAKQQGRGGFRTLLTCSRENGTIRPDRGCDRIGDSGIDPRPDPTLSGFPLSVRQKARRADPTAAGLPSPVRLTFKHFHAAADALMLPLDAAQRAAEMIGVDRIQPWLEMGFYDRHLLCSAPDFFNDIRQFATFRPQRQSVCNAIRLGSFAGWRALILG